MYRKHFGMKRLPFSIAPDPRYLYMSEQHREALAHLIYGIRSDGGFVLLTGEVGTGKTTTCRRLLETLAKNIVAAFIIHPTYSVAELLAAVCDEFGISYPRKTSIKALVDRINAFLLDLNARHKKAILIIDEAQNLSPEVLEEIRLLTNLETNERKLLQIILVGQPELRDKLARPELRQLAQRIVARCHLGPLSKADVVNYVNHRLTVARGKGEIFSQEALNSLYVYGRGIPRLINVICDRALLGAFVQGKESVDRATLTKAAAEVLGEHLPGTDHRWQAALLAGILIFTGVGLLYYYFIGFEPRGGSEETGRMSGISKPVPEMPQAAKPGVSGTQPDNPEGAQSGGVSKPVPEMPQAAEPGVSGTQPDNPEGARSGGISKRVPEMPQAAEPGAAGTQPDNPEGARSGGISKRVPEMPQAAEPGAAGTQPDNPEGAQSGPQEQGTEARGPAE
jgi:general secretion pathway protein A